MSQNAHACFLINGMNPSLQPDPFEGGYNIAELYREREDRDDEVALTYATFFAADWWRHLLEQHGIDV
jgi:hypothetical protein